MDPLSLSLNKVYLGAKKEELVNYKKIGDRSADKSQVANKEEGFGIGTHLK